MLAEKPIFITGCPKSGTSLAAGLLSAHPEVELDFDLYPSLAFQVYLDTLGKEPLLAQELHIDPLAVRTRQLMLDREIDSYNRSYFGQLHSGYAKNLRWGSSTKEMFLWYYQRIKSWYPEARFIFIIRDPRDVYASFSRATMYEHDRSLDSFLFVYGEFYHLTEVHQIPIIRYEDMVVDDALLFAAAGLERPHDTHAGMRRVLLARCEKLPVIPEGDVIIKRIGRWKNDLTPIQVDVIENHFGHVLEKFYS